MELSSGEIKEIVMHTVPEFNPGSHLPNDHSQIGNKGACKCARTERRLFDRLTSGKYLVLMQGEN